MDKKPLYRSKSDRMVAGVCAGLAEYFDTNPAFIRILFLLLALAGGPGILIYIVCIIAIPEEKG